jgi:hypothetical protein
MPDYKFTFQKTFDLYFEAATEHEAWVQAMSANPDVIPCDWDIKLNESWAAEPPAIDEGPVEVDDWPAPDPL